MTDPTPPKPTDASPLDLDDDTSRDVGMAEMDEDGTLRLHLRAVLTDGTVGEAMLIVPPKDDRYPGMLAHLAGIKPVIREPSRLFPSR